VGPVVAAVLVSSPGYASFHFSVTICLSRARPRHQHGYAPYVHLESSSPMNEKDRREYVSKVLVVKHVIRQEEQQGSSGEDKEESTSSTADRSSSEHEEEVEEKPMHVLPSYIRRFKSNLILSDHAADDLGHTRTRDSTKKERWACVICLNPYEIGEEICWSQNPDCLHLFHHGCIEEWLLQHDHCPCCRADYLASEDGHAENFNSSSEDLGTPPSHHTGNAPWAWTLPP
jgi:hypothetical protein